ncbi:hypothetical protein BCR33DRAFT_714844 [Rhizoclosmatium globosum]|uniref:Uncharacterized protein n=1 Tax=Rhizoclosmatium globosum TaxID=329046 RepID=A0A1Y2CLF5_9FUNG|nr:hypothetical protein BCR33DRAFT_714844 [Rhizoclosmatium globosum]|eukprot:ORY47777.1 hypothetical protein BCR33DRAFT_714844 [Rhizoclosmatium globosum]
MKETTNPNATHPPTKCLLDVDTVVWTTAVVVRAAAPGGLVGAAVVGITVVVVDEEVELNDAVTRVAFTLVAEGRTVDVESANVVTATETKVATFSVVVSIKELVAAAVGAMVAAVTVVAVEVRTGKTA